MSQPRNQVFVSYAHADDEFLQRLRKHLVPLERRNIRVWTDKDIAPGMDWNTEIRNGLASAKVAVLLISTDFLTSDFITREELPPLLDAARAEGVQILPVVVKPSSFGDRDEPLSRFQAVNMNRPLAMLDEKTEREAEFVKIFQAIRKAFEGGAPQATAATAPAAATAPPAPAARHAAAPVEVDDVDGEDGEAAEATLAEALQADFEAMAAERGRQALVLQATDGEQAANLMIFTEGRRGAMLCELMGNDELPEELQLSAQAQRELVTVHGFAMPESRGDRFWMQLEEGVDLGELAGLSLELVAQLWDLPNDQIDLTWEIVDV